MTILGPVAWFSETPQDSQSRIALLTVDTHCLIGSALTSLVEVKETIIEPVEGNSFVLCHVPTHLHQLVVLNEQARKALGRLVSLNLTMDTFVVFPYLTLEYLPLDSNAIGKS